MLRLRMLIEQQKAKAQTDDVSMDEDVEEERIKHLSTEIITAIMEMTRATIYCSPDVKLVQILSSLFNHLGYPRLSRLVSELKLDQFQHSSVSTEQDGLVWDLNLVNQLLPNQLSLIDDYMILMSKIDPTGTLCQTIQKKIPAKLYQSDNQDEKPWLNIISPAQFDHYRSNETHLVIDIPIFRQEIKFADVIESLIDAMPRQHKGRRKLFDTYVLTTKEVDSVQFKFFEEGSPVEADADGDVFMDANEEIDLTKSVNETVEANPNAESPEAVEEVSNSDLNTPNASGPTPVADPASSSRARATRQAKDIVKRPLIQEMFVQQDDLLGNILNQIMLPLNLDIQTIPLSLYVMNKPSKDIFGIIMNSLMDWTVTNTEALITPLNAQVNTNASGSNTSDDLVKEILTYNGQEKKMAYCDSFEHLDQGKLKQLLLNINKGNYHIYQIRIQLIKHMFTPINHKDISGATLITNGKLKRGSINSIRLLIDSVEMNLLKTISKQSQNEMTASTLNVIVSILEVLIDSYLETVESQRRSKTPKNKSRVTELDQIEQSLSYRIEKWSHIVDDFISDPSLPKEYLVRYYWSRIIYLQTSNQDIKIDILLKDFHKYILPNGTNLDIKMINFENILPINKHEIDIQLSKLKIIDQITKRKNTSSLLETILIPPVLKENPSDDGLQLEVKKIIDNSHFDLKFKLWFSLFKQTILENNMPKVTRIFSLVISDIKKILSPENLTLVKEHERTFIIWRCLGYLGNFAELLLQYVCQANYEITSMEVNKRVLEDILQFYQYGYLYLMYQDSTHLTHGRKSLHLQSAKSFNIMNELIVNMSLLLIVYATPQLNEGNNLFQLVNVVHEELGVRYICSLSQGRFLKYCQYALVDQISIDNNSPNDASNEVIDVINQIVHCRLGVQLSNILDHKCKSTVTKVSIQDVSQLAKFIHYFIQRGKNHPLITATKAEVKTLLDTVIDLTSQEMKNKNKQLSKQSTCECAGKNDIIETNLIHIGEYLNKTDINTQILIGSFLGQNELALQNVGKDDATRGCGSCYVTDVVKNGAYYFQACNSLHHYKSRKRNMQTRFEELEDIVKLIQIDLSYGINRLESWILLGQCFGLMVEDDLVWTSDKINSSDKRKNIAFIQKKSILCYLMAVDCYYSRKTEEPNKMETVMNTLWESLGFEMYNSWFAPLNKLAYHVKPIEGQQLKGFESNDIGLEYKDCDLPNSVIIKTLQICFINSNNEQWLNKMYLSKSMLKLNDNSSQTTFAPSPLNYDEIFTSLVKSCQLAWVTIRKDEPIVEPHYQLFISALKAHQQGGISIDQFISILLQDPLFTSMELTGLDVDTISLTLLDKICAYDKKNWQHRPIYRKAMVYAQKDQLDLALAEMDKIVNLKTNVRNLITIWKPDVERSGRHFYYCGEYSLLLGDLLYRNNDIAQLMVVIKKMRKLGSTMTQPLSIFDVIMTKLCLLMKRVTGFHSGLLDLGIIKLKMSDFVLNVGKMGVSMKSKHLDEISEEYQLRLYFLNELQGLKKIAHSYGTTGFIDEVFNSIFIMFYYEFVFEKFVFTTEADLLKIVQEKLYLNEEQAVTKSTPTPGNDDSPMDINEDDSAIIEESHDQLEAIEEEEQEEQRESVAMKFERQDLWNHVKDLPLEDKIKVMHYAQPVKISNLTKEKSRITRRDIGPVVADFLQNISDHVTSIITKYSKAEGLPLNKMEKLSKQECDELFKTVVLRQTKESKEEFELQKLGEQHDVSLDESSLIQFNEILGRYSIDLLRNGPTRTELAHKQAESVLLAEKARLAAIDAKKQEMIAMAAEKQAEKVKEFLESQRKEEEVAKAEELPMKVTGPEMPQLPNLQPPAQGVELQQRLSVEQLLQPQPQLLQQPQLQLEPPQEKQASTSIFEVPDHDPLLDVRPAVRDNHEIKRMMTLDILAPAPDVDVVELNSTSESENESEDKQKKQNPEIKEPEIESAGGDKRPAEEPIQSRPKRRTRFQSEIEVVELD